MSSGQPNSLLGLLAARVSYVIDRGRGVRTGLYASDAGEEAETQRNWRASFRFILDRRTLVVALRGLHIGA